MNHHLKSNYGDIVVLDVSPESAGWNYLSFRVVKISKGQVYLHDTKNTELALVPLRGSGAVQTADGEYRLARTDVFKQKPDVLYLPPDHEIGVTTSDSFEFAVGAAPAEGKYPLRLFSLGTRSARKYVAAARRGGKSIIPCLIPCRRNA